MGGVLKKVVIAFQVVVVFIFVAKVITMTDGFRKFSGSYGTLTSMGQAMAQTPVAPAVQPASRAVQSEGTNAGGGLAGKVAEARTA
jgi:hypothetical protein